MISGIIKVEVSVISRSLTSTLIIPDITKTESNNFFYYTLSSSRRSQSPIFSPIFPCDRRDRARLTVNGGHLDF